MNKFPNLGVMPDYFKPFENGPIPVMTAVDPAKEPIYQEFVRTHPETFAGPTRNQSGQLIPSSLYDMRGAVYAGIKPQMNAQDLKPHYSDYYKLPGYSEQQPNIGNSVFSNESALSKVMPQNAGFWHGSDDEYYPVQPMQKLNPDTFYPAWFGQQKELPRGF